MGRSVLFFGCRNSNEDYIYREELEGYLADGTLNALYTAFSREQAEKVYVQHRIRYVATPCRLGTYRAGLVFMCAPGGLHGMGCVCVCWGAHA